MKSSRAKMAARVFLAAVALSAFGCGGANKADSEGQIVSPKLPGSSVASPATGGEEGGTGTGGTESEEESSNEQNPALIMHIINGVLN